MSGKGQAVRINDFNSLDIIMFGIDLKPLDSVDPNNLSSSTSRPSSRRSEDSGMASWSSTMSSRESSPNNSLKLDFSSSTSSLGSPGSSPSTPLPKCSGTISNRQRMQLNRSKSLKNAPSSVMTSGGDLKKKPLMSKGQTSLELEPRYQKMTSITMEVKRPLGGRKGWIASPLDPNLDLRQLELNGILEKLMNDLRIMELSGKEVPNVITVRL